MENEIDIISLSFHTCHTSPREKKEDIFDYNQSSKPAKEKVTCILIRLIKWRLESTIQLR